MSENKTTKIFCIGSNIESYECLNHLVANNCKIDTLLTLPAGQNKNVSDYYDLHPFCEEHGINVIDTTNVNSEETVASVKAENPDYLFTLGWSQIFRIDFINCFSKFVVGTHPSKLPYGRGRAPLPWTILEDLDSSAVSFFKIDTGVDTGSLIFQRDFDIPPRTYVKELYTMVGVELSRGFHEIHNRITSKTPIQFLKQEEEGVTIRGKRSPSDGLIEFQRDKEIAEILIRAVGEPYPGAYTYYKDQKIIFWEVEFDQEGIYFGTLGQIHKKSKNGILVQFENGNLWLNNPTNEDKEPFEMKFFRIGDKLGYSLQDEIYNLIKQR